MTPLSWVVWNYGNKEGALNTCNIIFVGQFFFDLHFNELNLFNLFYKTQSCLISIKGSQKS